MAAQGDKYLSTTSKLIVKPLSTIFHNPPMKTPTKSPAPRRKSGFQQYLLQEQHSLSSKYPFLTSSQIKSKAAQNWFKLSGNEKEEYKPAKICKKTPVKKQTPAARVAAARSPGCPLKRNKNTENYMSPFLTQINKSSSTALHPVALKSPRAPRKSFDYDYFEDDSEPGITKIDSETSTPISQSDDSMHFDKTPTEKHYGGSSRIFRRIQSKPPDVVHDKPTCVQSGILKECQAENNSARKRKNKSRVSFGGTRKTIIKRQRYLTPPSSDASFSPAVNDQPSDWIRDHKKKLNAGKKWDDLSENNTYLATHENKEAIQMKAKDDYIDVEDFYGCFDDGGDSDEDGSCQLICREEEFVQGDERSVEEDMKARVDYLKENLSETPPNKQNNDHCTANVDEDQVTHLQTQTAKSVKTKTKRKVCQPQNRGSFGQCPNDGKEIDKKNTGTTVRITTRSRTRSMNLANEMSKVDNVGQIGVNNVDEESYKPKHMPNLLQEVGKEKGVENQKKKMIKHEQTVLEMGTFKMPSLPIVLISRCNARSATPEGTHSLSQVMVKKTTDMNRDDCTPQMPHSLLKATIKQAVKVPKKQKRSEAVLDGAMLEQQDDLDTEHKRKPRKARKRLGGSKEKKQRYTNKLLELMSPYEKRKYLNKIKPLTSTAGETEVIIELAGKSLNVCEEPKINYNAENSDIQGNSRNRFSVRACCKKQVTLDRYLKNSNHSTGRISRPSDRGTEYPRENTGTISYQEAGTTEAATNKESISSTVSLPSTSKDSKSEYHFITPILKPDDPLFKQQTKCVKTRNSPEFKVANKQNDDISTQLEANQVYATAVNTNRNPKYSMQSKKQTEKKNALLSEALTVQKDDVESSHKDETPETMLEQDKKFLIEDVFEKTVEEQIKDKARKSKKSRIMDAPSDVNTVSTGAPMRKIVRNVRKSFTKTLLSADDTEELSSSESTCVSQGAAVVEETIMLMRKLTTPSVISCPRWMDDDNSVFSSPNILSPVLSGVSELSGPPSICDLADDLLNITDKPPDKSCLVNKVIPETSNNNMWRFGKQVSSSNDAETEKQPNKKQPNNKPRKSQRLSTGDTNNNLEVKNSASTPVITNAGNQSLISCDATHDLPDVIPTRRTPGSKSYSKPHSKQDFSLLDLFDKISPPGAGKTPKPSRRLVTSCEEKSEYSTSLFDEDSIFA